MADQLYTKVPYISGHDHFTNKHIASFPDLHAGPSFEEKGNYLKETLKYQLMTGNGEQAKKYINMRQCMKLEKRDWVEFCLNEKVPGVTLEEAAKQLGLRKI